jgi:SAM-dependent methyltransferase
VVPQHQRDFPFDLAEMVAWVDAHARPGERVLDIGSGDGSMVAALADRYDAVGVDPAAEPGDRIVVAPIEEYEAEPFDVVFASTSLHHLADLDAASVALRRLTRAGTAVLVREFDCELMTGAPTLEWWFRQRRARALIDEPEADGHELPSDFDEFRARVIEMFDHHVHPWPAVAGMLAAAGVETVEHVPSPYLFRWDLGEEVRSLEEHLIAAGRLPAVGIRWTGRVTS